MFPYSFYHVGTYVKRLARSVEASVTDAKYTGSCWLNVRALFFCACVNVFAYALENSHVCDM